MNSLPSQRSSKVPKDPRKAEATKSPELNNHQSSVPSPPSTSIEYTNITRPWKKLIDADDPIPSNEFVDALQALNKALPNHGQHPAMSSPFPLRAHLVPSSSNTTNVSPMKRWEEMLLCEQPWNGVGAISIASLLEEPDVARMQSDDNMSLRYLNGSSEETQQRRHAHHVNGQDADDNDDVTKM